MGLGSWLRACAYILFGWLLSSQVLAPVLDPMLTAMTGGSATAKGDVLYESLASVNAHSLTVVVLAALFSLLAAAVVETRLGGAPQ